MKRAFKNIPKVVRKQIWFRMAVGAVFLLFFITTWISTGQFRIGLMLLLFATLILVNGGVMIYNCVTGRYMHIIGKCVDMERTKLLGRTKRIHVETENTVVSIPMHRDLKNLHIGDHVHIYLPVKATVMTHNDVYVINQVYAVKAERKKDE